MVSPTSIGSKKIDKSLWIIPHSLNAANNRPFLHPILKYTLEEGGQLHTVMELIDISEEI